MIRRNLGGKKRKMEENSGRRLIPFEVNYGEKKQQMRVRGRQDYLPSEKDPSTRGVGPGGRHGGHRKVIQRENGLLPLLKEMKRGEKLSGQSYDYGKKSTKKEKRKPPWKGRERLIDL